MPIEVLVIDDNYVHDLAPAGKLPVALELAAWQTSRTLTDMPEAARASLASIFFTDVPKPDGMPVWFPWSATALLLAGVVLLNLFFAGLARKLLR